MSECERKKDKETVDKREPAKDENTRTMRKLEKEKEKVQI